MTDPAIAAVALVLLAVGLAVVILDWRATGGRGWPELHRRRPTSTAAPFCAWCVWRDGDLCTHPQSPVGQGQPCGPACVGRLPCPVRQERRA